jgi:DNA-binding MarR family transcriptional regulator
MTDAITAIRAFNRFYTRRIGVLREGLSQSRFSLTEARILYELAHHPGSTASDLCAALDLDPGYVSRILDRFARDALLRRERSAHDRRRNTLTLTEAGRAAFTPLDLAARTETASMLGDLDDDAQQALVAHMAGITRLLSDQPSAQWTTRAPEPGDIGWVIARHGALYAQEYGFDHRFEALVAQVAGAFLAAHDPSRERCWIAVRDGVRVGSVFLVRQSDEVGKLRLLIVEPSARGLGIGKRLVEQCITFARHTGYRQVTLWTNDVLLAARGIYRAAGFRLVKTMPHHDFGPAMVGEDWELDL